MDGCVTSWWVERVPWEDHNSETNRGTDDSGDDDDYNVHYDVDNVFKCDYRSHPSAWIGGIIVAYDRKVLSSIPISAIGILSIRDFVNFVYWLGLVYILN